MRYEKTNIHIMGIPEEEETKIGTKNIFNNVIAKCFQVLEKM